MPYNRDVYKQEAGFLIMESLKEEEALPREMELLMWKHSPIDVTGGVLDAWLEEAGKKYLIRDCQCYELGSPEAIAILEDEERVDELLRQVRSKYGYGALDFSFGPDGAPTSFYGYIDDFAHEDF